MAMLTFLAFQKRGGVVAIKSIILAKLSPKLRDGIWDEINILKELHHPHVVALFDCKQGTAHLHIIMEYCPMGDLSIFLRKRTSLARNPELQDIFKRYPNPEAGGLNEVIVRHFLKQLASALQFLNSQDLVHRDVKPQNLLVNPPPLSIARMAPEALPYTPKDISHIPIAGLPSLPMLKLADFGFARHLPKTSLAETLCGSPLYMAPEILRYERYDAKADLWSTGILAYELSTGRPPWRSSNHIDLLRKVELSQDVIKFAEEPRVSREMKTLIRSLLKRHPVGRMNFQQFFDDPIIKGEIPGLVGDDIPQPKMSAPASPSPRVESVSRGSQAPRRAYSSRDVVESDTSERFVDAVDYPKTGPTMRRPSISHTVTAPPGQTQRTQKKQGSSNPAPPSPTDIPPPLVPASQARRTDSRSSNQSAASKDTKNAAQSAKEAQEQAAHDIAFERDYVVVEKRAVEVNALADELAASPRIHGGQGESPHSVMRRRNTTQNTPPAGVQVAPTRALQIASGKRSDHFRQGSYERRFRNLTSTSSTLSKAVELATGRLMNFGLSPPLGFGRTGGPSPPLYNPFPAYPATVGGPLMIEDGGKGTLPQDEDSKTLHAIEESAHRSDVVYGFAEVKYKQIIPLAPSVEDQGLGLQGAGIGEKDSPLSKEEDCGLTVDAMVTLSEEALVLYVKSLSLLARSMDIAGAWWAKKTRIEAGDESAASTRSGASPTRGATSVRVNKVVQWVRDRFNEVLEKAEFVRLKLIASQQLLPLDHPSHPSNHPFASTSTIGASSDNVRVSAGVSAEKLMWTRALEMGKSAAVNELVGEDLPGCEISYVTAIRMLEAVLDSDDENAVVRATSERERSGSKSEADEMVNAEDREAVIKGES